MKGNSVFSLWVYCPVPHPSGAPSKRVRGGPETVRAEDFRSGEAEAAGARRAQEGCGSSGKASTCRSLLTHSLILFEFSSFFFIINVFCSCRCLSYNAV